MGSKEENIKIEYRWKPLLMLSVIMWNVDIVFYLLSFLEDFIKSLTDLGFQSAEVVPWVLALSIIAFTILFPIFTYIYTIREMRKIKRRNIENPYKKQMGVILTSTTLFVIALWAFMFNLLPAPSIYSIIIQKSFS